MKDTSSCGQSPLYEAYMENRAQFERAIERAAEDSVRALGAEAKFLFSIKDKPREISQAA